MRTDPHLKCSITVKAHLLESHAPDMMDTYGSLSQFLEENMESWHHRCNLHRQQYSNITKWAARESSVMKMINRSTVPAVQQEVESVVSGAKRKFSTAKEIERANKRQTEEEAKEDRMQATMLTVNMGLANEV